MSWLTSLDDELLAAGVRGPERARILAEFVDHVECEPGCESRLGDPATIATTFAADLRVRETRRASARAFAALALAAVGVTVTQRSYVVAGGWPTISGDLATVVSVTGIAILLAIQIAFAAGALGALRALRLRRAHDASAAEFRLVQRRFRVACVAAALADVGMLAHTALVAALLPWWWTAISATAATVPLVALLAGLRALRLAALVTADGGPAARALGGDVPVPLSAVADWLSARWLRLALAVGIPTTALMLVGSGFAERSWIEGINRAVGEAAAVACCLGIFGRRLGIRAERVRA